MEGLLERAKLRYEKKVPPGYMDAEKPEPERYGDYILWLEIIERSRDTNLPVILVVDDRKEDWWYRCAGKTFGPRPELVKEFCDNTGKRFHMYTPDTFLEHANKRLDTRLQVKEDAIEELRTVRNHRRQMSESAYSRRLERLREKEKVRRLSSSYDDESYMLSRQERVLRREIHLLQEALSDELPMHMIRSIDTLDPEEVAVIADNLTESGKAAFDELRQTLNALRRVERSMSRLSRDVACELRDRGISELPSG